MKIDLIKRDGLNVGISRQLKEDLDKNKNFLYNVHLMMNPFDPYLTNIVDEDLIEKRLEWHLGCSSESWKEFDEKASKDGKNELNSNYGILTGGDSNFNQYYYCFNKLCFDKNSKNALIIYNRPSIQVECCEKGKDDFIKINYSHFFIEDNKLDMVHSQSECDYKKDLPYDFAWAANLYQSMFKKLKVKYPQLKEGDIHYNIDCLYSTIDG